MKSKKQKKPKLTEEQKLDLRKKLTEYGVMELNSEGLYDFKENFKDFLTKEFKKQIRDRMMNKLQGIIEDLTLELKELEKESEEDNKKRENRK